MKNSHTIFGPDIAGVIGKTVRHDLYHVTIGCVAIPRDFLKLHKYINLVYDVMFVNKIPFMITMSLGIIFITVEHVTTRTTNQISKSLKIL